jgi:hypothetical protein
MLVLDESERVVVALGSPAWYGWDRNVYHDPNRAIRADPHSGSWMAVSTHGYQEIGGGEEVEGVPRARANRSRAAVDNHDHGGRTLERATQHVNNFPNHLVVMTHTGLGTGNVVCIDPSHPEVQMNGAFVIDEWDNTEQIRKDFE